MIEGPDPDPYLWIVDPVSDGGYGTLAYLNLEPHDVTAGGCAHQPRPHILLLGVQLAHVARVLVVVNHLFAADTKIKSDKKEKKRT
jgi:hypothetical protein